MRPTTIGLLLPTAAVIIGSAVRFWGLDAQSLWIDEVTALTVGGASTIADVIHYLQTTSNSDRLQPLYFLLLYGWTSVFGTGDGVMRGLSAAMGSGSVIVIALIAHARLARAEAGWATVFAAASAYAIYYSQEARPYALCMLLACMLIWLFGRRKAGGPAGPGTVVGFAAMAALSLLASIFFAFFLTALALADLIIRRDVANWSRFWAPAALAGIAGPGIWLSLLHGTPSETAVPASTAFLYNLFFVPYGLIAGQTFGPSVEALHGADPVAAAAAFWPQLAMLGAACTLWAALVVRLHLQKTLWAAAPEAAAFEKILALAALLGFAISAIAAFVAGLNWLPRHVFFLYPLMALLLPLALRAPVGRGMHRVAGTATLALLIGLNGLSLYNYAFNPAHGRDDYRGAARIIAANNTGAGLPVVVLNTAIPLLRHYGATSFLEAGSPNPEELASRLDSLTGNAPELMLVVNRDFYWSRRAISQMLAPTYRVITRQRLAYFSIYWLRREQQK